MAKTINKRPHKIWEDSKIWLYPGQFEEIEVDGLQQIFTW